MFISSSLIFVHIPKTGGNSVRSLLLKNLKGNKVNPPHLTYDQIIKHDPKLSDCESFCVIRNPFDRFVSTYRFIYRDYRLQKWFGADFLKIKESIDTMEKFINSFVMPKSPWSGHDHFTQQVVWSNNVENIFKLEEPEKILKFLKKFGIDEDLPHLNSRDIPSWKNNLYRNYYSSETKKIIAKKFEDDLNKFNYDF